MFRSTTAVLGSILILSLSGCGSSCESLEDEMMEIGREIRNNPESAMDRSGDLEELGAKYREMGCTP